MANTIRMVIQLRRASTAEWEAYKHLRPAQGEPCFDYELNTLKIGDGIKTYEDLEPIGGVGTVSVAADGTSIVLEDGVFKLSGFDAAATGAQPRKNADGNIEWVVPSTETVEGLQTTVAGLQSDVTNLQVNVTTLESIVGSANGEGEGTLLDRVASLESGVDTLNGDANTVGSVLQIVQKEINAFATNVTSDGVVNSYKELIDYVADHGPEAADMAADIKTLQDLVGNTKVSDQIAAGITGKVDAEQGKSLVADTLIAKLESIENGAQANNIETVRVGDTVLEVIDKTVVIPVGAGLKSSDEITVSEDGTISVKSISFSKITQEENEIVTFDGGGAAG